MPVHYGSAKLNIVLVYLNLYSHFTCLQSSSIRLVPVLQPRFPMHLVQRML
jgi:hypothetical protein